MNRLFYLKFLLWRLVEPARRNAEYFQPRRHAFAMIAVIAFPLYYVVWHDLFPQPYENLTLRIIGSGMFVPILFSKYWPSSWKKMMTVYWPVTLIYSLPFFFTFMLLKNNSSAVWVESTLVALFVMVLLLDWVSMILQTILGAALAWLAYYLTTPAPEINLAVLEHLPVAVFAMVLGAICNYANDVIHVEQERAMLATAGSIAHELRTPLLGIKSGAAGLRMHLPALIAAYNLAREHKLSVPFIRTAHLDAMAGVLERIELEVNYSNAIMEMLIANVRLSGRDSEDQSICSVGRCLELALERYPFTEKERHLVSWEIEQDIRFRGSELLMVHVLFNLLKNALRHIALAGKGEIRIRIESSPRRRRLYFRDTGSGIPALVLPHIFKRFYSAAAAGGNVIGSGIGLAFCRDVMTSIGGGIDCSSEPEQFTEFVLTFPELAS